MAFMSNADRLKAEIAAEMARRVERAANVILENARVRCPADTGALRESGQVEMTADGGAMVTFGRGLPDDRAAYTEFGTVNQAQVGYLRGALYGSADEVKRILGEPLRGSDGPAPTIRTGIIANDG